ncbi:MAG: hypothetical protein M1587_11370 [Thaumarchaeota archaeon]|nr:hypothetical protein [Nitrososphaerota archaeon]
MDHPDGRLFPWKWTSSIRNIFRVAKQISEQPEFKPKDLRTWFDRRLTVAKVDKDMREVMMGHSIPGIRGYYERFTKEELESEYVRAYPSLKILD